MAASMEKQVSAMDSLAWEISYQWNRAKNRCLTMADMQKAWTDSIVQSANYQCLAEKRKETIRFLWHHTRQRVLTENQLWGLWFNGAFYSNWCDLPESVRYDEQKMKTLPKGHFWIDGNREATVIRHFVSDDSAAEDKTHFLSPLSTVRG